jgi:FkbM family methyltransferase
LIGLKNISDFFGYRFINGYKGRATFFAKKKFYGQFIKRGDLCFDIGANIGERTKIFSQLGGRVVSFEPSPHCFNHLVHTFKSNPLVTILPYALGAFTGKTTLNYCRTQSELSTLNPELILQSEKWENISVSIITLDNAIKFFGRPDFCKIDVEGYEAEVLKGLHTSIPSLSIEYLPVYKKSALSAISILGGIGSYEYNYSIGESFVFSLDKWATVNEIISIIHDIPMDDPSGDIYARLVREN